METIFSSDSNVIMGKKLLDDDAGSQVSSIAADASDADVAYQFDIELIVEWVRRHAFKRVALQFPDELLNISVRVNHLLNKKLSQDGGDDDCKFFILADTSYGSCCVDVVASEHYGADSIVHFGHSCLSPIEKMPVLFVFEKQLLDLDAIKSELVKLLPNTNEPTRMIVIYDVCYEHLYTQMCNTLGKECGVFVSKICRPSSAQATTETAEVDAGKPTNKIFSRTLPDRLDPSHVFVYIGARSSVLNQFLFYFNKNTFYQYTPSSSMNAPSTRPTLITKTSRELARRYYLIERARDANIFGILVGTMSVANYNQALDHVTSLLRRAKRRYYMFLIGKLNCPKLNNFMEVDMYVMIACNENSIINAKELNKPIVTLYELEVAFNCARLWGQEYVCDYRELLPGGEQYVPLALTDLESDVSLITGKTRLLATEASGEQEQALIKRDDALSVIHYSGAGEFLANRSWKGLEQQLGKVEVTAPIEGQKGIAAGYENETK